MSEYILILVIFYVGKSVAATSILFPTQAACETAKAAAIAEFDVSMSRSPRAVCVPRNSP
jgi:hypothetical protein